MERVDLEIIKESRLKSVTQNQEDLDIQLLKKMQFM